MKRIDIAFAASAAVVIFAVACGGVVAPASQDGDASSGSTNGSTSGANGASGSGNKTSAIGQGCTRNADCVNSDGSDAGLTCYADHQNIEFPGGNCTEFCRTTSDCPGVVGQVFCGVSAYDLGSLASCVTPCTDSSSCRSGYDCLAMTLSDGTTANGCWTRPTH